MRVNYISRVDFDLELPEIFAQKLVGPDLNQKVSGKIRKATRYFRPRNGEIMAWSDKVKYSEVPLPL